MSALHKLAGVSETYLLRQMLFRIGSFLFFSVFFVLIFSLSNIVKAEDLTLSSGTTSIGPGTISYDNVTLSGTAILNVAGNTTLNITNTLYLTDTAVLYTKSSGASPNGVGVTINATTLTIDANARIDGNGLGYYSSGGATGYGPGYYNAFTGGSHGGLGAPGNQGMTYLYGSASSPISLGSCGYHYNSGVRVSGGSAVKLTISGTTTLNGSIQMNGAVYTSTQSVGGSGGSIWLTTNSLDGSGTFQASGLGTTYRGGGGRIAIYYNTETFTTDPIPSVSTAGYNSGTVIFKNSSDVKVTKFNAQKNNNGALLGTGSTSNTNTMSLSVWSEMDNNVAETDYVQFEVRTVGTPFQNVATSTSSFTTNPISSLSPTLVTSIIGSLSDGDYHWQARIVDSAGTVIRDWNSYPASPTNTEDVADFTISNGGTLVNTGLYPDITLDKAWTFPTGTYGFGNLTINSGVVLTATSGSTYFYLSGNYLNNGTVSITASSSQVSVAGDFTNNSSSTFYALNVTGDINNYSTLTSTTTTADKLYLPSGIFNSNGVLTANSSEVKGGTFNANSTTTITGELLINGGSYVSGNVITTTANNLTETSGSFTSGTSSTTTVTNDLTISGGNFTTGTNSILNVDNNLTTSNTIYLGGGSTTNVDGIFHISGSGIVYTRSTGASPNGVGVTINAGDLTIDTGAKINGNGLGYLSPGGATGNGPGSTGGTGTGSYGGLGSPGNQGATYLYGSATSPISLGSTGYNGAYASGGGAVKLIVTGTTTLEGSIQMNGNTYNTYGAAGGSIWLTTNNITGSGYFQSNGGGTTYRGGGGRIAVYYNTETFTTDPTPANSATGYISGSVIYRNPTSSKLTKFNVQKNNNGALLGTGSTSNTNTMSLSVWSEMDNNVAETDTVQFEVRAVGTPFQNVYTSVASFSTNPISSLSPTLVTTTLGSLANGDYHWQARIVDSAGTVIRDWNSYPASPTNTEDVADFTISNGGTLQNTGVYPDIILDKVWTFPTGTYGFGNFTINSGVVLTATSGPIIFYLSGNFLNNGTANITASSNQVNVVGDYTNNSTANLTTLNVTGDINNYSTLTSTATTADKLYQAGGTYTLNGVLTANSFEVKGGIFNANSTTTIAGELLINGGSYVSGNVITTTANNLTETSGSFTSGTSSTTTVTNDITVSGGGFTTGTNSILNVDNNFTASGTNTSLGGGSTTNVDGIFHISGSGVVYTRSTGASPNGIGVTINAGDLTIDTGAKINGNGLGYYSSGGATGSGPGATGGTSSASYGGLSSPGNQGSTYLYGSASSPVSLGSAGYYNSSYIPGGSAVKLIVTGATTLEGSIQINGNTNGIYGGSGGSIWLTTNTLTGSGTFQANGGGTTNKAGGGRIAVYYNAETFTTNPTPLNSATGYNNGTVIFRDTSSLKLTKFNVQKNNNGVLLGTGSTSNTSTMSLSVWSEMDNNVAETDYVQFEVRTVGTPFQNVATSSTSFTNPISSVSPVLVTANIGSLVNGDYHWQARIVDSAGTVIRDWNSYPASPTNTEDVADFTISNGGTLVNTGLYPDITLDKVWTIPTGTYGFGNFTINSGVVLTATSGPIIFYLSGNFLNNGTANITASSNQVNVVGDYTNNSTANLTTLNVTGDINNYSTLTSTTTTADKLYQAGGTFNSNGVLTANSFEVKGGIFNANSTTTIAGELLINGGSFISGNVITTTANNLTETSGSFTSGTSSTTTVTNDLTISGGGFTTGTSSILNVDNNFTASNTNTNLGGGSTTNVDGIFHISGSGIVYTRSTGASPNGVGVTINAGDVTIDSGARIDGNGMGYNGGGATGYGPGILNSGSHGGLGYPGNQSPTTYLYGSASSPVSLGSAGYYSSNYFWGGGAVKLVVTGTTTLEGSIQMNGNTYSTYGAAGGSIWLTTNSLTGSGTFQANGGGTTYRGGGGRIAVYYNTETFTTNPTTNLNTSGNNFGTVIFRNTTSLKLTKFNVQKNNNGALLGTGSTSNTSTMSLSVWSEMDNNVAETDYVQFEVRTVGTPFQNVATSSTSFTNPISSVSPVLVTATIGSLANGDYHWQARIVDSAGTVIRDWNSYPASPTNTEDVSDFTISNGGTLVNTGLYPDITLDKVWTIPTGTYGFGNFTINSGIILTATSGSVYVYLSGNFLNNGTANMNASYNQVNVSGDFTNNSASNFTVLNVTGDINNYSTLTSTTTTADKLYQAGGTFNSNGVLTANSFEVKGGTFNANSTTTIAGELLINGGSYVSGNVITTTVNSITETSGGFTSGTNSTTNVTNDITISGGVFTTGTNSTLNVDNNFTSSNTNTYLGGGSTTNVDGIFHISGSGIVYTRSTGASPNGVGVTINAGDVTIDSGARIDGNGMGYNGGGATGYGPGNYNNLGSHGGLSYPGNQSPTTYLYGSSTSPVSLGSAGYYSNTYYFGGGAVKLVVTGTTTLEGSIQMNGQSYSNGEGGASGGSIWLTTNTLTGSGSFQAKATGTTLKGGGGRIAVYYNTETFTTNPTTNLSTSGYNFGTVVFQFNASNVISNLVSSLTSYNSSNWTTNLALYNQSSILTAGILNNSNNNRVALIGVDLTAPRNWTGLTAGSDSTLFKSYITYSGNLASIPGISGSSYTLYVPKSIDSTKVGVCPGATNTEEVSNSCTNMYYLNNGQTIGGVTASSVTEGEKLYWKISGLTLLGGGFESNGVVISNIPSGLTALLTSNLNTNVSISPQTDIKNISIKKSTSLIAAFDVNFSGVIDWTNLIADSSDNKSIIGYSGGNYTNIPGRNSSTYTMYVPKSLLGIRVGFCPNATDIAGVSTTCSNLKYIDSGTSDLIGTDTVNVEVGTGTYSEYWVITGLSTKMGAFDSDGYVVIGGAIPENIVVEVNVNGSMVDVTTTEVTGLQNVEIKNNSTSNLIAELPIDFSSDVNLGSISGDSSTTSAFFHSTVPISTLTQGGSASYILYVPKGEGDRVWICPGASSLNEVTLHCSDGYFISEGQTVNGATASVVSKNNDIYWKIDGLTGTGGMSVLTGLKDTLSRLKVGTSSDHTIVFGTNYGLLTGSSDTIVLTFPEFDLSTISITDIELTDNVGSIRTIDSVSSDSVWGANINTSLNTITLSVPTSGSGGYTAASRLVIKIGTNAIGGVGQIINPSLTGSYLETIVLNNTNPGEMGDVIIPIVDSDQVDVTGYVTAYINFDIDTNTDNADCPFNGCKTHENGEITGNYTVDLGELSSTLVNKSNSVSVVHSDSVGGLINSIYFDIGTNAPGGVVVLVKSLNGGLIGPGTNKIESVIDGDDITANSGKYGYNITNGTTVKNGTILPNIFCDTEIEYCGLSSTLMKTVFDSNNWPVDSGRVRLDLAAAANYTNNPGLYTDTLTFVATATF